MRTLIDGKFVLIASMAIAVVGFMISLVGPTAGWLAPVAIFVAVIYEVRSKRDRSSPPAWPVSREPRWA